MSSKSENNILAKRNADLTALFGDTCFSLCAEVRANLSLLQISHASTWKVQPSLSILAGTCAGEADCSSKLALDGKYALLR